MQNDAAEIRFADGGSDQRVQYVADQRRHNRIERGAQNHGDREVDHVSAQNEISKSFQHRFLLCIAIFSRYRESAGIGG